MTEFFGSLLALAVVLGLLITVHEFGHFWVARKMGVKVLRFSVGFGKPLWRRQGADGTEYVIAGVPLGGYVKMLDEREGEVPAEELHRAFNRQRVAKRFAIVVAGPLFNFLLAIAAFWLMFISGIPGLTPLVGEIVEGSPADRAGLRSGQQIIAVNGERTPTWDAVLERLLPTALVGGELRVQVESAEGGTRQTQLELSHPGPDLKPHEVIARIGLRPYQPKVQPVIGEITPGSPADRAGLQAGDRPLQVAGHPVDDVEGFIGRIREHPGEPVPVVVMRNGERLEIAVRPEAVDTEEGRIGRIGAAVGADPQELKPYRAEWRYGPLEAATSSVAKTWEMSVLTLRMLGEMIVGRASVENISGPITIARFARESALDGFARFLSFLAIVSISLGVLNLLPIPVLDGGHLMFYLVEAVKGRPVSERTEAFGQRLGIAVIIALMTLAFYNDLARLAG